MFVYHNNPTCRGEHDFGYISKANKCISVAPGIGPISRYNTTHTIQTTCQSENCASSCRDLASPVNFNRCLTMSPTSHFMQKTSEEYKPNGKYIYAKSYITLNNIVMKEKNYRLIYCKQMY